MADVGKLVMAKDVQGGIGRKMARPGVRARVKAPRCARTRSAHFGAGRNMGWVGFEPTSNRL